MGRGGTEQEAIEKLKFTQKTETFDGWCSRHAIKGVYQEALYHYLQATREGEALNDPEEWKAARLEMLLTVSTQREISN